MASAKMECDSSRTGTLLIHEQFDLLLLLCNPKDSMHKSTLDLFCNHEDDQYPIDEAFVAAIEKEAARYEVTVDYYMMEFMP